MRGLRALCCYKDDQDDDEHTPPNRPAQRLERTTQIALGNIKNETSSTDMTQDKPPSRDLWKEAYEKLDSDRKKYVSTDGASTKDAINSVIEETTAKYEQWKKGGLRIHRKGRDDINLRESAERIISAAMKAKDVISTIVSFDPTGHASSAWTVISFGLSIVQNRIDRRDAIFAAAVYLAETLAYYALIDNHYRNQNVGSDWNLDETLLRVYTAILEYTSEVNKAGNENAAVRISRSISQITDQPLEQLKITVNTQRAAAKDWIDLAANLGDRKAAEAHLAKIEEAIGVVKNIELRALSAEEERQLEWISAVAYSGRQRELQKRRTNNTGNWLLDSDKYNEWKSVPGSLLWLYGVSGCGKSVLCSTVIHDIEETCQSDPSISLAYWYFQFDVDEMKSVDNMTRSLIRQLSRSPLAPSVTKVWESHSRRGSQPDSRTISNVLRDVLSSIPGEVFLVFDALDECPENAELKERGSLLRILVDLLEGYKDKIHILATSRPEQDILLSLEQFPSLDLEAYLAEDVKVFVDSSIADSLLNRYNSATKKLIADRLLSSKERRFRWAELQIKELEKCHTDRDIKDALAKIPPTLEASYRKVLNSISPRDTPLARDILIILCLSPVVLDLKMVAGMVKLDFPQDVVKICTTSLVSEFNDQIRVAHFSVQEFLTDLDDDRPHHPCQFSAAFGHKYLAEMSLDCVLAYTQPLTKEEAIEKPLLIYGAKCWYTHVDALGGIDRLDPEFKAKALSLFTDSNVYFNWVSVADREGIAGNDKWHTYISWSVSLQEYDPPIYRASSMGLLQAVNELLRKGTNPNVKALERTHGNALQAASYRGHDKIVQTLLDRGADVNAEGGFYGSALQAASSEGHDKIVQMLLDRGANVDAQVGYDGSALQAASSEGHDKIVQMLLDRGADVNTQGGRYGSALQAASYRGHTKIVQMLLDRGADVNIQEGDYGSALQIASSAGHDKIVQMLLDRDADVNAEGGKCGSALRAASSEGHDKIVQMLLNRGANVNAEGGEYRTALQAALFKRHDKIVQMLLDRGADVDAQEGAYGSPLQIASSGGHDKIVQILLDRGANVNAQGRIYGSALQIASFEGHDKIVQILLDRGADVNSQGGRYGSALRAASYEGHDKVVQILLDRGANVNAEGEEYGSALQDASFEGHDKIVQMLLDRGANMNNQRGKYGSALQGASYRGHDKIVQMLLDRDADVNAEGEDYGSALQAASYGGHDKIVQMLLDQDADVNAEGGRYGNALQAASYGGHDKIVQMLLDQGANVNAEGGDYGSALQAASSEGHDNIIQMLLDRGANVNSQGGIYGSALQAASSEGHDKIVQMLLDGGAGSL